MIDTDNCDLDKLTLNLINRLQAEKSELQHKISELEIELKSMRGAANSYKAENERLQEMLQALYTAVPIGNNKKFANELQKIKAEAYKEFAERVKQKAIDRYNVFDEQEYPYAIIPDIDDVLKELVGDADDRSTKD